ncbi:hypothetical protein [Frankia sp. R82]|uniref:hypothetical protein n=1 Tax=Frankia sp. R82 TaxID=2950553 RepID=UPI002044C4DD|nr:hypothetical protein [Frankia sp. R82]MCM3882047.1 hypothetical protein [Frankia sp. R82]
MLLVGVNIDAREVLVAMRLGGAVAPRLPRSLTFSLACTGLAAVAHTLAHGGAPSGPVLAGTAGGVALLAAPFAAQVRPRPLVIAAMVALQAGLHTLFALTANSTGRMYSAIEAGLCIADRGALSDTTVRHMVRVQASLLPAPHQMPLAPWQGAPTMLGAHLAAAAATALLLQRCDEAASTAARLLAALATVVAAATQLLGRAVQLGRWLRTAAALTGGRRPARPPLPAAGGRRPAIRLLRHTCVRRGPPLARPVIGALAGRS